MWGEASGAWSAAPDSEAAEGACILADECCKVCQKGQACGDSCISATSTCQKGRGCACDAAEVCP